MKNYCESDRPLTNLGEKVVILGVKAYAKLLSKTKNKKASYAYSLAGYTSLEIGDKIYVLWAGECRT